MNSFNIFYLMSNAKRKMKLKHLFLFLLLVWVLGGMLVFAAEHSNPDFATPGNVVWNISVYLFSGFDSGRPESFAGKILVIGILVASTISIALITGSMASLFVEMRTKGRFVMSDNHKLKNHYVICNWNDKSEILVQQLHADELNEKRTIIVISDDENACVFQSDSDDSKKLDNVFLIRGNPAELSNLRRANVQEAHSVIVLADMTQPESADGKSIFTCMAIKEILFGSDNMPINNDIFITVEAVDQTNVRHFKTAGANEVICQEEFATLLLSQSAYQHGLASVFRDLMTFSDNGADSNELYRMKIPEEDIANGITFVELAEKINKNRDGKNPAILVGGYSRSKGKYILNPRERQVFDPGDEALLLAWSKPEKLY